MATLHWRTTLFSAAALAAWGCTDNAQDPPLAGQTHTTATHSVPNAQSVASGSKTEQPPLQPSTSPSATFTVPTSRQPLPSTTSSDAQQAMGGAGSVEPQPTASGAAGGVDDAQPSAPNSSGTDAGTPAPSAEPNADAEAALQALKDHLALPRQDRPALPEQGFATVPLDKARSAQARELLWQDYRDEVEATRREEFDAKVIERDELRLRYDYTIFGDKPATGRSLFISLHGGGNAEPSVNDEQWENQKQLYQPDEGVYLSPRAPTDTWNLWHEAHIDPMFERLIADLIVFEEVNPNRVYVMGYSAGGDGVYQLGPRMADHWAAASAMAGHPNEAQPLSLRNIGFTVHVGALDSGYDRNLVAGQWGEKMDALQAADPEGYVHLVQLHAGKEHWMDLEDAVAVPWMAEFTRDPLPRKIVWLQDDITHTRSYWLAVPGDAAVKDALINAELDGQHVELSVEGTQRVQVRFSDELVDLDQPVSISVGGVEQVSQLVPRTIYNLWNTLQERGDPALVFDAELELSL